jgi:hypothetical protein
MVSEIVSACLAMKRSTKGCRKFAKTAFLQDMLMSVGIELSAYRYLELRALSNGA